MPNDTVQVTITSVCNTSNNAAQLSNNGSNPKNQIQWNATGQNSYTLQLPGGVFQGHDSDFSLTIGSSGFQPSPPLQLVADPSGQTISNYIYQNGSNCPQTMGDPPPEIVIDANSAESTKAARY